VRRLAPNFAGVSYERLAKHGGIQWPCRDGSIEEIADNPPVEQLVGEAETSGDDTATAVKERTQEVGTKFLHSQLWADEVENRAPFHPVDHEGPVEQPDEEYPFQLTTGRRLAFYNTGTMTQSYKKVKDGEELLEVSEEDAGRLGLEDGGFARVSSRRGTVPQVRVRITDRVRNGLVFMGCSFPDQVATNVLTINALDPLSGTAELKACAVKVEPAA
jgi:formate dehydrogenase major subunit